jgi:hypothetical protein
MLNARRVPGLGFASQQGAEDALDNRARREKRERRHRSLDRLVGGEDASLEGGRNHRLPDRLVAAEDEWVDEARRERPQRNEGEDRLDTHGHEGEPAQHLADDDAAGSLGRSPGDGHHNASEEHPRTGRCQGSDPAPSARRIPAPSGKGRLRGSR